MLKNNSSRASLVRFTTVHGPERHGTGADVIRTRGEGGAAGRDESAIGQVFTSALKLGCSITSFKDLHVKHVAARTLPYTPPRPEQHDITNDCNTHVSPRDWGPPSG